MSDVEKIGSAGIPLNIVDANGRKIMGDAYDNTATYAVGDYCINGDHAYKCIIEIETPEDFNTNHWQQITIEEILKEHDASIESVNASLTKYVETTTNLTNIPANTGGNVVVYFDLPTGYKAIGVMLSTNGNNLFSAWVGDRSGDHFRLMYYNQRTSATSDVVKGTVVCVKDNS